MNLIINHIEPLAKRIFHQRKKLSAIKIILGIENITSEN
jgi:hypothetical protein